MDPTVSGQQIDPALATFCRQVRDRSNDHRAAIEALRTAGLPGQIVSILRQELDSLVRVMYLLSVQDRARRSQLIADALGHPSWRNRNGGRITDREMVDLAERLHNWAGSVYRFGCAFIHLSSFHDYRHRDPLDHVSEDERRHIIEHMRYYHGGPHGDRPNFAQMVPYLPNVFAKIADNLECYVQQLERDGELD